MKPIFYFTFPSLLLSLLLNLRDIRYQVSQLCNTVAWYIIIMVTSCIRWKQLVRLILSTVCAALHVVHSPSHQWKPLLCISFSTNKCCFLAMFSCFHSTSSSQKLYIRIQPCLLANATWCCQFCTDCIKYVICTCNVIVYLLLHISCMLIKCRTQVALSKIN